MTFSALAILILAQPQVRVADDLGCVPEHTAEALTEILRTVGERPVTLRAAVRARELDEGTRSIDLVLITPEDEVVLERSYEVPEADCANVDRLLVLVTQTFLEGLPLEQWWEPPPPPPPPPPPEVEADFFGSVASRMFPFGAEIEAGGRRSLVAGSPWHIAYLVRAGAPARLGNGRFQDTTGMLGIGRAWPAGRFEITGEIRAGGTLVSGIGYSANRRAFLPWAELSGAVGTEWRGFWWGLEAALSPIRHEVETQGLQQSQSLALARLGLIVRVPTSVNKR